MRGGGCPFEQQLVRRVDPYLKSLFLDGCHVLAGSTAVGLSSSSPETRFRARHMLAVGSARMSCVEGAREYLPLWTASGQ
jgi:hypothetical protein